MNTQKKTGIALLFFFLMVVTSFAGIVWSGEQPTYVMGAYNTNNPHVNPNQGLEISIEFGFDINGDLVDDFFFKRSSLEMTPSYYAFYSEGNNRVKKDALYCLQGVEINADGSWRKEPTLMDESLFSPMGEDVWIKDTGYIGLQFEAADGMHFGWAHVTVYGDFRGTIIHDWAYNSTPGEGIVAGTVPEPSSAILTVIGAMSVWVLRRQNRISKHWKES